MLSDEEKKAIEYWKTHMEILHWNTQLASEHYIKVLLNLIEKLSKEIEELKTQIEEHVYYDLGGRSCGKTELLRHYKKGYDMNNKFWKDKIKAKIEEYEEKIKKIKEKGVWEEPYDTEKYVRYTNYIYVLQSLLEKE